MAARKSYNEYLPPSDRSFNRMIGINSRTVKQLTTGSIAGLCVGVTLRIFSRALAFSVGAGILFFQWLASKGYHIFPSRWLEKKIHGVKLRHILDENAPFKLSMASTVLLAAFGELDAEE
ncbi:hypothetical protein KEM55_007659 [Ascosphaera atra]|nr:hypothetical protein KEM55_007659 [Ascosphaera atra]